MVEKKMTKRQKQAAQTKDRLVACALALISERGYENITIGDICQAAGVSNGNFYHYFDSKEDILLLGHSPFDTFVEEEFSKLHFESPTEGIFALFHEQVEGILNLSSPATQAEHMRAQLKCRNGRFFEEKREFHRCLRRLVDQAIETGEIHPSYSGEEVARLLLQTSRGILYDWTFRDGSYSMEERTMETLQILFVGLRCPKPEKHVPMRFIWAEGIKEISREMGTVGEQG